MSEEDTNESKPLDAAVADAVQAEQQAPTEPTKPPRRHHAQMLPASDNKRKVGKGQSPPHRGAKTPKNSHTSPRAIVANRKRNEAVQLREQGYTYCVIAKHLGVSVGTVHGWIVETLRAIPLESAQEVLRLELQRLDGLLSAFYENGVEGDLPAADMALKIIEKRARLLGLYPEMGKPSPVGVAVNVNGGDSETLPLLQIEFVDCRHKDDELDAPAPGPRVTVQPRRDYREPDPGPVIDVVPNKPNSGVPFIRPRKPGSWMD